eukprot:CAMPEP_0113328702 /NCGR_PEP_ID=MMETSP0010_2-20120614/20255_1 /TAXON_ID=216773 ORGANISM="Corethron hystrix, Strain 308" /NCGR_SAMPLE_ID=MMETSP0010_2 /ASSEMBLY_ACC=CAM_ASM_000155 /LENGTH=126 /DNA_ID=CAMNT_0000190237 /DNA_START=1 /DNA_END=378 /DNA_ORIENTATION=+ /assembly_acc=CAM_ASM_000155
MEGDQRITDRIESPREDKKGLEKIENSQKSLQKIPRKYLKTVRGKYDNNRDQRVTEKIENPWKKLEDSKKECEKDENFRKSPQKLPPKYLETIRGKYAYNSSLLATLESERKASKKMQSPLKSPKV